MFMLIDVGAHLLAADACGGLLGQSILEDAGSAADGDGHEGPLPEGASTVRRRRAPRALGVAPAPLLTAEFARAIPVATWPS